MKVILLENVAKIGNKFDIKDVASGYANNFLFPKKLAEMATKAKIKNIEVLKTQQIEEQKIQEDLLVKNIGALSKAKVEIFAKANEKGHLFQGIHVEEISKELREQSHIDVLPAMIDLKHSIKKIGEFEIVVRVKDKEGKFKLSINPITEVEKEDKKR